MSAPAHCPKSGGGGASRVLPLTVSVVHHAVMAAPMGDDRDGDQDAQDHEEEQQTREDPQRELPEPTNTDPSPDSIVRLYGATG